MSRPTAWQVVQRVLSEQQFNHLPIHRIYSSYPGGEMSNAIVGEAVLAFSTRDDYYMLT